MGMRMRRSRAAASSSSPNASPSAPSPTPTRRTGSSSPSTPTRSCSSCRAASPTPSSSSGRSPPAAASIPASDELAAELLDQFCCIPVFLSAVLQEKFDGFCELYLRPVLHYLLPGGGGQQFNTEQYSGFITANTLYANRVCEILIPEEDLVLVHDYPLWALPTILRRRSPPVRINFFLRSPFPSSIREDLVRALLHADLVTFRTCDDARHFLSAFSKLGLSSLGEIAADYSGRTIVVLKHELSAEFATNFRVLVLGRNLQRLLPVDIRASYNRSSNRLLVLDYDGTVMPKGAIIRYPSLQLIHVLNDLCSDPKNTVLVVSGRRRDELAGWFEPCERVGISAEHGCFTRWSRGSPWVSPNLVMDMNWKLVVKPVMQRYTDATVGSFVEAKETGLAWHYEEADPYFGSCQAKELQDHLLRISVPVTVEHGHKIVEVYPQVVGKGIATRDVIVTMGARFHGKLPDFILCLSDERSDNDMFASVTAPLIMTGVAFPEAADIFACTIPKYMEDPGQILKILLAPQ